MAAPVNEAEPGVSSGVNAAISGTPAVGIHGNSHVVVMAGNNLQVADLIQDWLARRG